MTKNNAEFATDLADRFWEGYLELEPTMATAIGDERYDAQLEDPSEEGVAKMWAFYKETAKALAGIDRSALNTDLRSVINIIDFSTSKGLAELECRADRLWAVTHMFGPQQLVPYLARIHQFDTPERVANYTARMAAVPEYLDATCEKALIAAAAGQTQPLLVVERAIGQVERLLGMEPAESPMVVPLKDVTDVERDAIVAILKDDVWPAFGRYLECLKTYAESARVGIGLTTMTDGDAVYEALIQSYTTQSIPPAEVHQTGWDQFETIMQERQAIAEALGFESAKAATDAYTESGKNTPESREALLEFATEQVERAWDAIPGFFSRLPNGNCEIRPVEEFQENDMPAAYYTPLSADGSRPGVYWVNTGKREKRKLHQLAAISFHEANPGHHMQFSVAQEYTDRHPIQRFGGHLVGSSFVEGWGLYSERLADEMGLYVNEYERIGMLEAQAQRACRLIVDSGIHALGWSREKAIAQMEAAGVPAHEAEVETDRYIAMPAQALSYMTGQLAIQGTRAAAEKALGGNFSLKAFHDKVMALGALPLNVFKDEMLTS